MPPRLGTTAIVVVVVGFLGMNYLFRDGRGVGMAAALSLRRQSVLKLCLKSRDVTRGPTPRPSRPVRSVHPNHHRYLLFWLPEVSLTPGWFGGAKGGEAFSSLMKI